MGNGSLTSVSVQFDCPHFLEGLRTFHLNVVDLSHHSPSDATGRPSGCPDRTFNESPSDISRKDLTNRISRTWYINQVPIMIAGIINFKDFVVEVIFFTR